MSEPICDLDAERAVLGAALVSPLLLHDIAAALVPADFYRWAHQRIYTALLELHEQRKSIDMLTLKAHLDAKTLDDVGGPAYLFGLVDGVPRSINAGAHCVLVAEKALRRRLSAIGTQAIADAQDVNMSAQEAMGRAEQAFHDAGRASESGEASCSIGTAIAGVLAEIETAVDTGRPVMGLLTGYRDLDTMTRGLHPGNLIILAARPGQGKSALALLLAIHAARSGPVLCFSVEMSRNELAERALGAIGRVDMHALLNGRAQPDTLSRLSRGRAELDALPLEIDDVSAQTVTSIRSKARRLQRTRGLALVVVDYIQLLNPERRSDNRVTEVGAMSRGLKQLAGELNVPVLACAQLNRASEARTESKPRMADLRESGSLEQDANTVWLLHRPEAYLPTPENAGIAQLIIAKNRKGPTGLVTLRWSQEWTRFDDLHHAA